MVSRANGVSLLYYILSKQLLSEALKLLFLLLGEILRHLLNPSGEWW